jgi:hypothetical protein
MVNAVAKNCNQQRRRKRAAFDGPKTKAASNHAARTGAIMDRCDV